MKTTQTCVKQIVLTLVSVVMLGSMAPDVSAAVTTLLNDSFTTTNTTDINANLARQSGTLAPISYVIEENSSEYSISGNALKIVATTEGIRPSVSPVYNFTSFNNYSISVDVKLVDANGWNTFIIGNAVPKAGQFDNAGTNIFLTGAKNGSGYIFDPSSPASGTYFDASAPDANGYWNLRFDISTVGASITTGNATVNVYVQNALVSTFTRTSAYLGNYISMGGQDDAGGPSTVLWDNLNVTTTVVPEPSAALLFGLGGLIGLVRRARAKKTT